MSDTADQQVKPVNDKKKEPSKAVGIITLIILGLIIWGVLAWVLGPKAKYDVSDIQVVSNSDSTVSVSFKVKNSGSAKGTPLCTVQAHSDDEQYHGSDGGMLADTINPGDTLTTAMPININNNGAANVDKADVTCN